MSVIHLKSAKDVFMGSCYKGQWPLMPANDSGKGQIYHDSFTGAEADTLYAYAEPCLRTGFIREVKISYGDFSIRNAEGYCLLNIHKHLWDGQIQYRISSGVDRKLNTVCNQFGDVGIFLAGFLQKQARHVLCTTQPC